MASSLGMQLGAALRQLFGPRTGLASNEHVAVRTREFEFIYAESVRNLAQQSQVLDSVRTRAGLLIAAANVVTALFAGPTFDARQGPTTGSLLAIFFFLVSVAIAIWIVWPKKGWNFRFGIADIVEKIESDPETDLVWLQRRLAVLNDDSYLSNEKMLNGLFDLFRWASIALVVEVGFWLTALLKVSVGGIQF